MFIEIISVLTFAGVAVITWRLKKMSQAVENLTVKVQESTTVQSGAIVLLTDLSTRLKDLADDPAAINALADELDVKKQELAAAIVANTPAA